MLKYQMRISPRIPAAINRYEFFLLRKLSIADVSFQMIVFYKIILPNFRSRSRQKNEKPEIPDIGYLRISINNTDEKRLLCALKNKAGQNQYQLYGILGFQRVTAEYGVKAIGDNAIISDGSGRLRSGA